MKPFAHLACLVAAVLLIAGGAAAVPEGPGATTEEPPVTTARTERRGRSCKTIAKQIARYQGVVQMAQERGDELWEESTEAHIDRLLLQQQRRCPQDVGPSFAARLARLLELAAKGFLTAASFGAFGL